MDINWPWIVGGGVSVSGLVSIGGWAIRRLTGNQSAADRKRLLDAIGLAGHVPLRVTRTLADDALGFPMDELTLISDSLTRTVTIHEVRVLTSGIQGPPRVIQQWSEDDVPEGVHIRPRGGSYPLTKLTDIDVHETVTAYVDYSAARISRTPFSQTVSPIRGAKGPQPRG